MVWYTIQFTLVYMCITIYYSCLKHKSDSQTYKCFSSSWYLLLCSIGLGTSSHQATSRGKGICCTSGGPKPEAPKLMWSTGGNANAHGIYMEFPSNYIANEKCLLKFTYQVQMN